MRAARAGAEAARHAYGTAAAIASQSCSKFLGLIRCAAKPAPPGFFRRPCSCPYPLSAIAAAVSARAKLSNKFQAVTVGQPKVADQQVETPLGCPLQRCRPSPASVRHDR